MAIVKSRSISKALAAACAAAVKVWGEAAEYGGLYKVGPVCYADGRRVPKEAPEFQLRGSLYEGPYEGTLFQRVVLFRFHDRGVVEVRLVGPLGYAFPGDRPSIYWSVARIVVYRWGRLRSEPALVELVRLSPDQIGRGLPPSREALGLVGIPRRLP